MPDLSELSWAEQMTLLRFKTEQELDVWLAAMRVEYGPEIAGMRDAEKYAGEL